MRRLDGTAQGVDVVLDAVIMAVTGEAPRILTVPWAHGRQPVRDGLPYGHLDPAVDRTLERALRAWVRRQTAMELGYVEQLYTFGDAYRHPAERAGGPRLLSIAYLALVEEQPTAPNASWRDVYDFFPWEDWREGRPTAMTEVLEPALRRWLAAQHGAARLAERAEICFGLNGSPWDPERVLERYELLYEAGLVSEAGAAVDRGLGQPMALDHRRIVATALGRLRGKIRYRPVVFELLPEQFTLSRLQAVVEALIGGRLHKQNFRRLVEQHGLVVNTGRVQQRTGGRPARLYRFRRRVLRERPAPGVGLPRAVRDA